MKLEEFEWDAICDKLEGWELADFLGLSPAVILEAVEEELTDEEYEDLMDFVGLRKENNNDEAA